MKNWLRETFGLANLSTRGGQRRLAKWRRMERLEDRTVPATMLAVDNANNLLTFDSATPVIIASNVAISGLQAGEFIQGIDWRPSGNGSLFALGITDNGATRTGRLYGINPATAVATAVGAAFSTTLADTDFWGFDFNPNVDLIRVTNNLDANFRLNPNTGAIVATDTSLNPAGQTINDVAYTNSGGNLPTTTLYALRFSNDRLVTIGGLNGTPSPNTGQLIDVGSLGIINSDGYAFDIEAGTDTGRVTAKVGGLTTLYTVNLSTGAATLVGTVGTGATLIRGLTSVATAITVGGTAGNDTLDVTLTGPNSGKYMLNNSGFFIGFSGITSFAFIGGAGADVLTINNPAGGLFAPSGGIFFHGGGQVGDTLQNFGGTATTGNYTPSSANNGTLVYTNGGTTQTINFTGLSPVNSTVAVATLTINATAAAEQINVVNGPLLGGLNSTQVNSGASATFELMNFNNANNVTINALAGVDTVTLNNPTPAVGLLSVTVDAGAGADSVTVQTAQVTTTITNSVDASTVLDSVFIGSSGSVQTITSKVTINNPPSFSNVTIDDSADMTARTATLTNTGIIGLSPGAINFANNILAALTISGGTGGNTFNVSTPFSGISGGYIATLNSGTGKDTVNVIATDANSTLIVQGGNGTDTVNIGSLAPVTTGGNLAGIKGLVRVQNSSSFTTLTIDDSGDSTARNATLDTIVVNMQTFGQLTGEGSAAAIQYAIANTGDVNAVNINGGSGGNTLLINQSGSAAIFTTTINTGSGADTVTVQATSANVIYALQGQGGTDTLIGPNVANIWNITGANAGNITGLATSFTNIENLVGGTNNDNFVFAIGGSVAGTIDGGMGTDTLDYSALTTSAAVNLGSNATAGAFSGNLDGGQEVVAQTTTANGTATYTYNSTTKTVDIHVTVSNLSPALVTGFHIHRAPVGVNGPIILDLAALFGLGSLVPAGSGFTFDALGVALPPQHEAAFIGGITYFNVHTAAAPAGLIRGQIFPSNVFVAAAGTATGTSGISNIENATGGTAADSLVGDLNANTLLGNGGNDTIVGSRGNDTMNGGANDDVLVWSNGDNNDVIDGGTDNDVVQVNGAVGGGDLFSVGANGTRVAFARTNLVPFALDIGTVGTLIVNGIGGDDTTTVNSLAGVTNLTALNLNGFDGNDTFNVTPAASVTVNVDGGLPIPPTTPGDTLNVTLTGTTTPNLTVTSSATGFAGNYSFGNRLPVNFNRVESLSPAGTDLSITVNDGKTSAIPGTTVTYTIVVTNNGPLGVTGASVTDMFPANLTGVTFTAAQAGGASGFTAKGAGNISDTVTMPVGSTITYSAAGTINPSAMGMLVNSAKITAPAAQPDPNLANNMATDTDTLTPQADLAVAIADSPDPVVAGQNITYSINVSNGASDAQNVQLVDILPSNTTFVSSISPGGWVVVAPAFGSTGTFTATRATLPGGAPGFSFSDGFTIVVRVNANTPNNTVINNMVSVSSATPDPVAGNNMAAASTTVRSVVLPIVTGADAGSGSHVKVFDPITGAETRSFFAYPGFTGGVRVAAGDVSGDGVADILTGAGPGGGPHVKVFDGATGAEIRSFFAYDAAFNGGLFVAAGDVNGDGVIDIITGADAGGGPHVKVFSGKDGSMLASFYAYAASFRGGVRVAAGDVDGDFKADIITGAGPGGGPHVTVRSGNDLSLLRSFYAFDASFTGGVYVAGGDLNNDGRADIITGAGAGGTSHTIVFSGKDGSMLQSFFAYPGFNGGVRVAVADVNADGQLDLITGAGPGGGPHVKAYNGSTLSQLSSFFAYDPSFMGGVFVG